MKKIKKHLFDAIDAINEQVVTLRHDLHAHPELSGHEEHTKYLIKGILEAAGWDVVEFENHFGLVANLTLKEGASYVALRADMDALPLNEATELSYASQEKGVMHACGHDSHTAILLGVGLALQHVKKDLPGNIRLIFQPAEEITDGGSSQMIADGALENVKAIFGLHAYPYLNTGQIGYKYGVMLASADTFEIEIFGKSAHGARPHEGVDAILVGAMVVNSLNHIVSRQVNPLHPAVISLGTIEGGKAANVICDHVKICGTVRTVNHDIREKLPKMMEIAIKGITRSMHATHNFDYQFGSPEVVNDASMTSLLVDEANALLGEENVVDLEEPVMGGEDFGRYLKEVKGAFFRLGICDEAKGTCVSQHNARFNVDDDALKIGMRVMAAVALRAIKDA